MYFQPLIFLCHNLFFFTKFLTSGILFSTAVYAELVVEPVILGVLPSVLSTLVL